MLALGAAVEAGRIYLMPGGPQPACHRLPNPAALVRAVDQNKSRHHAVSFSVWSCPRKRASRASGRTAALDLDPRFHGGGGDSLIPAGDVDRDARHKIGVARGEKADALGLVGGFCDAPQ